MSEFLTLHPEEAHNQLVPGYGIEAVFRESRWALGYDPGQSIDPAALVLAEAVREPMKPVDGNSDWFDPITNRQKYGPQKHWVRAMKQFPPRTDYLTQAWGVKNILTLPVLHGKNVELVVDRSGPGRPLGDVLRGIGLKPRLITITGGLGATTDTDGTEKVSKDALIKLFAMCLDQGELGYPEGHPLLPTLLSQLSNFRASIGQSGVAAYGAAGTQHDDLVLAFSYCTWRTSHRRAGSRWSIQRSPFA